MSTIQASNVSDGTTTVGTSYVVNGSAKAWANINGTGTITARDSLNVSSLVDAATGGYNYNFTNNMDNTGFITTTSAFRDNDAYTGVFYNDQLTSQTSTRHYNRGATTRTDVDTVYIVVHGDLA